MARYGVRPGLSGWLRAEQPFELRSIVDVGRLTECQYPSLRCVGSRALSSICTADTRMLAAIISGVLPSSGWRFGFAPCDRRNRVFRIWNGPHERRRTGLVRGVGIHAGVELLHGGDIAVKPPP